MADERRTKSGELWQDNKRRGRLAAEDRPQMAQSGGGLPASAQRPLPIDLPTRASKMSSEPDFTYMPGEAHPL